MFCKRTLACCGAASILLSGVPLAYAQSRPPKLVPPGWSTQPVQGRKDVIRYVSPDRRAVLTLQDLPRAGRSMPEEFAMVSGRSGGRITYRRTSGSWFVLSGYRGGEIFYTRVELACHARRWHIVELTYPRAKKRSMDAPVTYASHALRKYRNVCPTKD